MRPARREPVTALSKWLYRIIPRSTVVNGTVSILGLVVGVYGLVIAVNYLPMLLYTLAIASRARAREEVGAELEDPVKRGWYARRYGTQQFLLALPLAIPLLAMTQQLRKRARTEISQKSGVR